MLKCGQNMSDCKSKWQTAPTNKQSLSQTSAADGETFQTERGTFRLSDGYIDGDTDDGDCSRDCVSLPKIQKVSKCTIGRLS